MRNAECGMRNAELTSPARFAHSHLVAQRLVFINRASRARRMQRIAARGAIVPYAQRA